MNLSRLVNSAMNEWNNWLERPQHRHAMTVDETRHWITHSPPVDAFTELGSTILLMQDEIDLLHIKLDEVEAELRDAKRALSFRP